MKKYLAEFIGTFTLVLVGCGTAVVAGKDVGLVGISLAFGFALIAMAYGIGPVSGCHINPAVSLGVFVSGRMKGKDLAGYVVAQVLGAIVAAAVLYLLVTGRVRGYNVAKLGLGQNAYGDASPGRYTLGAGVLFELVATFLFVVTILGATRSRASAQIAGLAVGIALVAIHLFGIPVTGVSVNPARSLGPAVLVGGTAIRQVWMFLVVPSAGGVIAGLLFRFRALEA